MLKSVDSRKKTHTHTQTKIHHTNYMYIHFNGVDWSSPIIIARECVLLSSLLSLSPLSFCISFIILIYYGACVRALTLTILFYFRFLFGIYVHSKYNLTVTSIQSYFRNNLYSIKKRKKRKTKTCDIYFRIVCNVFSFS